MSVKIPAMSMVKTDKADLAPNQYNFFLDAWAFCHRNKLPIEKIRRVGWDVWEVVGVSSKK